MEEFGVKGNFFIRLSVMRTNYSPFHRGREQYTYINVEGVNYFNSYVVSNIREK